VIGINANQFHNGTTFLAAVETTLSTLKWAAETEGKGQMKATYHMAVLEPEIDRVVKTLSEMGLADCALELTRAKNQLRAYLDGKSEDPRHLFDSYRRRVHDALKNVTFLVLSETDREMIQPAVPIFGADVHAAFPSAAADIADAAKALTFKLFTASVFHCMRASEVALRSLADALSVSHANQTWEKIIQNIEKAIETISEKSHGPGWRESRQFYSESAAHFRFLKNAWRNNVMHSQVTYTAQEAKDIFNATRAWMQHLAGGLRKQERPTEADLARAFDGR